MKPTLLITGASGFLGKHLLENLDTSQYNEIYCFSRKREDIQIPNPRPENLIIVHGDLLNSDSYEPLLSKVDTVIHLAAATGKVDPKDYFKINTYSVMLLLDRCKKAGVKRFLFVSSIAVAFKNKYRYFYAHSKEQAEEYVKNCGMNFVILRPTMIMGKGSPVFAGLSQMSRLPLIPIFGRGKALIQPIHANDVASAICMILAENRFNGEILEIGGPEQVSIKEFMKRIAISYGKENPKIFHLPLGFIVFFLSILERIAYGLLPITVGQLASFRNDGTVNDNSLQQKLNSSMQGVDAIITDSILKDNELSINSDITPQMEKECRIFCNYLVKQKPNAYVLNKYYLCHQKINFMPVDFHDRILLKIARIRPVFTRMVDAYSRFFRANSTLRKKLAYLMAILDVSPPYYRFYDNADGPGKLGFLLKGGLLGASLAVHLLISTLFLLPVQVLSKVMSKGK